MAELERTRRIRRALTARRQTLGPGAFALGCAVWKIAQPPAVHAYHLKLLPRLIQAELEGQADASELTLLKRHLIVCASCATMYFELLELAERDWNDLLPRPAPIPPSDLGFLDLNNG